MKISIITPVLNAVDTIEDCIKSVQTQTYKNLEHIIIDGGSTDGTLEKIKKLFNDKMIVVSEPDEGIYDALNKGIKLASGEIIGILHSSDFYYNDKVLEMVAEVFLNYDVDSCYGDLTYVDKFDTSKIIRYWRSGYYKHGLFRLGWHPPHPTFFVKKQVYEKYGLYNTSFKIAGDYELMLRFLEKYNISTYYIPYILVNMRIGGKSNQSLKNIIFMTLEDYKAWKANQLRGGVLAILFKKLSKVSQFIVRPKS
ncbi:glycosyltransferase family 2 protein [Calditerrivibrio nitroreducens]|uniref:Glycosyl transferase family 2 n=1 Tax=Calditerrivibrio nitroreducens (strain DSM 19672 / NBRC 101217 / Yu37-1) TaxID=768670 RepID=E4THD8_CALNY|nr:glycosyltransferase family 2 protein [Calditerrivibrio nitroreducens]ADR19873.1 glycosyl transferase family 2 [Calditerrivibrio nitroreducens DSM 19672]